jgi:hypothetical protein
MFNVLEFSVSSDFLRGAAEIAVFLFGDKHYKRKVYYLAERGFIPVFRVGSMVCARKSTLTEWIASMERRHSQKPGHGGVKDEPEVA